MIPAIPASDGLAVASHGSGSAWVLTLPVSSLGNPVPYLSEFRIEDSIRGPSQILPEWVGAVKRRIQDSIAPSLDHFDSSGRWLPASTATAASAFFERLGDSLPSEPIIYGSRSGDLVAEFESPHGTMTGIISPDFILLFSVVDGTIMEKTLPGVAEDPRGLRRELRRMTSLLHYGLHAAVDPER